MIIKGTKVEQHMKDGKGHPYCPNCEKPTIRVPDGMSRTLMYYPIILDENGNNTNPDRNLVKKSYFCKECNMYYEVEGNNHDGYKYGFSCPMGDKKIYGDSI